MEEENQEPHREKILKDSARKFVICAALCYLHVTGILPSFDTSGGSQFKARFNIAIDA